MDYQQVLFSGEKPVKLKHRQTPASRVFITVDRGSLNFRGQSLYDYLMRWDSELPFTITEVLDDIDWSIFEEQYKKEGRAPYSPKDMFGLVLYGYATGSYSLRELERLAVTNVEATWACSGITPDYTTIAKFINKFKDLIGTLFETTTKSVLKKTNSDSSIVAVDGTTMRAASSNDTLRGSDGLDKLIRESEGICESKKEQLQKSKQELEIRQKKAKDKGRDVNKIKVSTLEHEAVLQPGKRGNPSTVSYKPVITSNEDQIITGSSVYASNETDGAIESLAQHEKVLGEVSRKTTCRCWF